MRSNSWSPDEEAWLRERYPEARPAELAEEHERLFGRRRSSKAIASRAKLLGLRKADGYVRNPPTLWTPERREWFRAFVPGHSEVEISAEHERLYGFPLTESQIGNAKTSLGVRSGTKGGQFKPGSVPANKGRTWDEFMSPEGQERSRATQFKKGCVHDRPDGWLKPIGYEREDADGYVWVKVRDSRTDGVQQKSPGSFNENYRLKSRVVWELANGEPVPPHSMVVFADGDKRNFDPENLVAVPRDLWSVISRQHWDYFDRESLEACVALAKLSRGIYAARKRPRNCKRCGHEFEPRYPSQRTCDSCLGERRK